MLLREGAGGGPFPAVDMDTMSTPDFPPHETLWGRVRPDGSGPWSILSPLEQSVMDKMNSAGTPLRDWDVRINYGIKTGYNDAFIINDATRQNLIAQDQSCEEVIKPLLRGRDIRRYVVEWANLWLIYSHSQIAENDYPSVRKHLLPHRQQLLNRRGGANPKTGQVPYKWWQLQVDYYNSGAYEDFTKEKLFWMDMSPEARFAYSAAEEFCNNKAYILTGGSLKYLCAVLNSSLITWMMRNTARTTGMGLIQ